MLLFRMLLFRRHFEPDKYMSVPNLRRVIIQSHLKIYISLTMLFYFINKHYFHKKEIPACIFFFFFRFFLELTKSRGSRALGSKVLHCEIALLGLCLGRVSNFFVYSQQNVSWVKNVHVKSISF